MVCGLGGMGPSPVRNVTPEGRNYSPDKVGCNGWYVGRGQHDPYLWARRNPPNAPAIIAAIQLIQKHFK